MSNIDEFENDTVTLTLDDGSDLECAILSIFPVDGVNYIALTPLNVPEEEQEIFFYRYTEDADGEPGLENIEDDNEYEAAIDAFDELLDEMEFAEVTEED